MILILIVSLVSCQETEKTLSVSVTELGEKVEEKMASETVADYDATLLLDDLGDRLFSLHRIFLQGRLVRRIRRRGCFFQSSR